MAIAPDFMTPRAPSSLLAMTVASATATIPAIANAGREVLLRNEATDIAYVAFGPTAAAATGHAIEPGTSFGPIVVPDGETQISAILASGAGNLRVTYLVRR